MASIDNLPVSEIDLVESLNNHLCVVVMSADGTIASVNDNYLKLSGYSREDLAGQNYRMLCSFDILASNAFLDALEKVRQGIAVTGMFRLQRADGNAYWLDSGYYPLMNADGELQSIVVFATDRTGEMTRLQDLDSRMETLNRSMLMAEFSPAGVLVSANENYLSAFGFGEEREMLGRHIEDLVPPSPVGDESLRQIWGYVSTGHTHTGRLEMITCDGENIWLESILVPIFGPGGKLGKVAHFATDVSWRIRNEISERDEVDDLALIVDQAGCAIAVSDKNNKVAYVNQAFTAMFGYAAADIVGRSSACVFGPHEQRMLGAFRAMLKSNVPLNCEEIIFGKNGQRHYAALVANPVFDAAGVHRYTVCMFTDITYTKLREVLQRQTLNALRHEIGLRDVLAILCQEVEKIIPEIVVAVMGLGREKEPRPLAAPSLPKQHFEALGKAAGECGELIGLLRRAYVNASEMSNIHHWKPSRDLPESAGIASCSASPVLSPEGEPKGAVAFCYLNGARPDPFHHRAMEVMVQLCALAFELDATRSTVRQMAFYDPVTSLPNRSLLVARAEQILAPRLRKKTCMPAAVMCLNIDRFKRVNDTLGFGAGNLVLDTVAKRLIERCKRNDLIGRLTGDEFAIVVPDCTADRAADLARRLQNAVSAPCPVGDTEVVPTLSIGISMFPENGQNIETLLGKADIAVALARKTRRNSFSFFSEQYNSRTKTAMSLESCLRKAVQGGELSLHYQPQVYFNGDGLYGAEALARWSHPAFGAVAPSTFIPLAEESGMIEELSDWVVREVARQVNEWRGRNLGVGRISLNLSAFNFHDDHLPERLNRHLREKGLSPSDITIELTEGVLLDDNPSTMTTIDRLNAMGFSLSLDDFGTGYSSLNYLRRLPVRTVKLDQVFIRDLHSDETSRRLSQAVVQLCKSLDLTLVVEGVENETQFSLLKDQGYRILQGYYISEPLPVAEFERWVQNGSCPGPSCREPTLAAAQ